MGKVKLLLGSLLLVIFTTLIIISMNDQVKIRVDKKDSSFFINEKGIWILTGTETNLIDGHNQINNDITISNNLLGNNKTEIIRTSYYDSVFIKDTYLLDGNLKDLESFPINHQVEIINGSGETYIYQVSKLLYSGLIVSDIHSPLKVGKMQLIWEEKNFYSHLENDSITIKYAINSDYEILNFKFFDPPTILSAYITPVPTYNNNSIQLWCNSTGGGNLSFEWELYKNGTLAGSYSGADVYKYTPANASCSGNWATTASYNCAKTYDNNFATYSYDANRTGLVVAYLNFTKPEPYANTSILYTSDVYNIFQPLLIPTGCDAGVNPTKVKVESNCTANTVKWYCQDSGTTWNLLRQSNSTCLVYDSFVEYTNSHIYAPNVSANLMTIPPYTLSVGTNLSFSCKSFNGTDNSSWSPLYQVNITDKFQIGSVLPLNNTILNVSILNVSFNINTSYRNNTCTVFLDTYTYNTNEGICYQETANKTGVGGCGVNTGYYLPDESNATWLVGLNPTIQLLYDENYTTGTYVTNGFGYENSYAFLEIKYDKPNSTRFYNANWQIGLKNHTDDTFYKINLSLPYDCLTNHGALSTFVKVLVKSQNNDAGAPGNASYYCLDDHFHPFPSGWLLLYVDNLTSTIYEEALFWNDTSISTSFVNQNISIINFSDSGDKSLSISNIPNGNYQWKLQCIGNQSSYQRSYLTDVRNISIANTLTYSLCPAMNTISFRVNLSNYNQLYRTVTQYNTTPDNDTCGYTYQLAIHDTNSTGVQVRLDKNLTKFRLNYIFNKQTISNYNSSGCYQESANIVNQTGTDGKCNILYNGSYIIDSFNNPYLYVNYIKPNSSITNNSVWVIGTNNTIYNVTVPLSCYVYSPLNLSLRLYSMDGYTRAECYNSSWINMSFENSGSAVCNVGPENSKMNDGDYSTGNFYSSGTASWCLDSPPIGSGVISDEAMIWNITSMTNILNTKISTIINDTDNELIAWDLVPDTIYYINVTGDYLATNSTSLPRNWTDIWSLK